MARALDDKTSTCGSCVYWSHAPEADGLHPTRLGYCGWWSVPAWVDKHIKNRSDDHTKMRADDGANCWQHTRRGAGEPTRHYVDGDALPGAAGGEAKIIPFVSREGECSGG